MYIPPEWKRRALFGVLAVLVLLPGWAGDLVPVDSNEMLRDLTRRDASEAVVATRGGDKEGEEWHVRFLDSGWARVFDLLNARGLATRTVPPAYVAHIPPGADELSVRADGYYRVETRWRWPWWWPGGGVDWRVPDR